MRCHCSRAQASVNQDGGDDGLRALNGSSMSRSGNIVPQDQTAWLLAIGRRLQAEYEVVSEPVPERLAALLRRLEDRAAAREPAEDNERPPALPRPDLAPNLAEASPGTSPPTL
jgi:hypothetical protein